MDYLRKKAAITCFLVSTLVSQSGTAQMAMSYSPISWPVDSENNEEEVVYYDETAPRTDLLRTKEGNFVYGLKTPVKFKIEEEDSGVRATFFKISDLRFSRVGNGQFIPSDLPEGDYRVRFYSVDNEGNQEQIRERTIKFDKTGPEIAHAFSTQALYEQNGVKVYPIGTRLFVKATDHHAGTKSATYQINDQEEVTLQHPETLEVGTKNTFKVGETYIVKVKSTDAVNNTSTEVIIFKVGE